MHQSTLMSRVGTSSCGYQVVRTPGSGGSRARSVRVLAEAEMKPTTSLGKAAPTNYSVSLFDAMKFNGPAPEMVNGRLAMAGLVYAVYTEAQTGDMIASQLEHVSVGTFLLLALVVYASMVPILKGVKNEAFGFFSPRAEIVNGRAAMLAFAALVALESKAGVPFF